MVRATKLPQDAMEELVAGGRLKRADILLTHSKGSLLGWLIRFGTKSYWNHAAMVFVLRSPEQGYDTTFIIESGGGGIDVHNIKRYFENPSGVDVAVKRLERDWFQDDDMGGLATRKRVRGFALQEIDDKYDYRTLLGIARNILRQVTLGVMYLGQAGKPVEQRRPHVPRAARRLNVNAYICSGFVQWAYYAAVRRVLEEQGDGDMARLADCIFNPDVDADASEEVLLSTTPADLARSERLSWKYLVKDGTVWEVASAQEVDAICRGQLS